jgi:hypothetical protein
MATNEVTYSDGPESAGCPRCPPCECVCKVEERVPPAPPPVAASARAWGHPDTVRTPGPEPPRAKVQPISMSESGGGGATTGGECESWLKLISISSIAVIVLALLFYLFR